MFWGLIIKEGKKYSKVVEQEFKLTNAALDLTNQSGDVQVLLTAQDVTYLLCTLNRQIPQTLLNKRFATGEEICFALKGKGAVHLTGNIIEDEYDFDEEMEDEEDEDEQVELANGGAKDRESKKAAKAKVAQKIASGQVSSDEDEDDATFNASGLDESALNGDDADTDDEEEDDEDSEDDGGENEDEDDDDEDDDEDDEEDDDDEEEEDEDQPKAKQAKLSHDAKSASQNGNAKAKESKDPKEAAKKPQNNENPAVRKLQDGLIVEDIKVGSGPEAKPGKKVAVYYVGRLKQNNKVFDSTASGAGFKFALGRGEVIKGWDLGVAGMKVGGKRRLTIPHKLAYGTKGSPPTIPPCSTLVFDVELKKVL
ncbi:46 kDa FK506-binding nuclear protein [Anopheles darlingi]|uniref:46 kDa FK506-binding nuclear protein n=1 Tax=Anopheles darlingi TaxID=43151 RepID=UPI0021000CF5|nr:46 kDa FK506-binding nuclear protein [Anopheles darlingi]